ncbi:hypothetical protein [Pseudoalteromonas spongiae]|uniref:hypothetical protein n=1 Tax=Pseudoalteromonas spongiae TaxID=298657 RepID=UPI000C2D2FDB|nr:hypothetical protein [Pseudoalteromonas spongiae]
MEFGKLIKPFKGKSLPLHRFLLTQWLNIILVYIMCVGLFQQFKKGNSITGETSVIYIGGIIFAIWLSYVTYRNMSDLKLTAYGKGIDVPHLGFFTWKQLTVRRISYVKKAPTVGFMPCFYIDIKDKKTIAIYQNLNGYTELYHLLYAKNVKGAAAKLLIYDTLYDGRHTGWKQEYIGIFDPKKNQLKEEKGDPLTSKYNC